MPDRAPDKMMLAAAAAEGSSRIAVANSPPAGDLRMDSVPAEVVRDLQSYFTARGDAPPLGALEAMNACTNVTTARYWLNRAYAGESSAEIFTDRDDTK
jgi:hypothetical protein